MKFVSPLSGFLLLCFLVVAKPGLSQDACNCPEPDQNSITSLCLAIYTGEKAPEGSPLSYMYQMKLYKMACADPENDSPEEAYAKIRCFWDQYAPLLRCYSYPTSLATDKNVLKFSLETGNTAFLMEAIKRFGLDLNVIDPDDGKTILDFVKESIQRVRNTPPVDEGKLAFYERVYTLLRQKGALHVSEIRAEK